MQDGAVLMLREIGVCRSVFANKRGVPRQGNLAPSTLAKVYLHKTLSETSLIGLDSFSHVWLIFVFSRNTNKSKVEAWVKQEDKGSCNFPTKIKAPLLHGKSTGLFSTRSPHRPNPIGMTLAEIKQVNVERRELIVCGIDLCDGTPIIDIKPFVPGDMPTGSEVVDTTKVRFAPWLKSEEHVRWDISCSPEAQEQIVDFINSGGTHFYHTLGDFVQAVKEVLQLDIRAVHQGRGNDKCTGHTQLHQCVMDNFQVFFSVYEEEKRICIESGRKYDASTLETV
uniref:TsaA-like domain-containing protein n=1 Tax=Mucochytrium quahogii TaxID=96639 RepID=A0A7S2SKN5_9STRA|mmetsp:Transcript_13328/g.23908  ORF Transcript_13328/g.23908 Transcript_13328/m.23908 type:complete len:281 (-) Transcript_13328:1116-1958(-)